jgi:hypothetical protein
LAKEIYPALLFGTEPPVTTTNTMNGLAQKVIDANAGGGAEGIHKKGMSDMRRTTSQGVIGLVQNVEKVKSRDINGGSVLSEVVPVIMTPGKGDRPKHKRQISRSQLR